MKKFLAIISAGVLFIATSCNKNSNDEIQPANDNSSATAQRSSGDGIIVPVITETTVFYNTQRFNVKLLRFDLMPVLTREHTMYVISESVPTGTRTRFLPVVDVLPAGKFDVNHLWRVVHVTFGPGLAPYQLTSAAEVAKVLSTGAAVAKRSDIVYEMTITYSLDNTGK